MALSLKFLSTCLIISYTSLFLWNDFCFACVFEKNGRVYDLSTLDWPGWQAVVKNGSDIVTYDISICRPLNYTTSPEKEICGNTSVCRHSNGKITEIGQFTLSNISVYDGVLQGGFMLFLTASECPPGAETKYYAIVNFMCGSTLGSPEVLMENECGVQFLWKTSAACTTQSNRNQVPCYVIDSEGDKRSLEGLASLPMHSVLNTNASVAIHVRVCNDINPEHYCRNCPPKTSAIRLFNGKKQSIGLLGSKVELTEEGLHLFYGPPSANDTLPEGCAAQPTTSIFFRCPERLKSRRPRVISDVDCQYEIEWETEHACPESTLKADFKTCKFTKEVHGVDLDLSPLKKTDGLYVVNGQKNVSFVFNMCGGLGDYMCNDTKWASSAVCYKNGSTSEIIAITNSAKLTLVERHLTLKYEGPDCREGKKQTTIFTFSCDHHAKDNGTGYPVHILSLDCTHFFSWETKYACLPYKPEIPCYVSSGGKYFDLRRLKKDHEFVWNVLSPSRKNGDSRQLYYMNVCGPAFGSMPHTSAKCEGDPAVTRIENNTCVNLGEFVSPPSYDAITQSLKMEYTNGSICNGNLRWSSVVEFKCYPGRFFSDVILTHVNEAGCVNEFEFRSAIACPSTVLAGKDCKLVDSETGLNIDLSPLSSSVYEVISAFGKFYLTICSALPKNHTCAKLLNSSHDVAACALRLNDSDLSARNLGAPSSQIGYVYGNVNVTYVGDKYKTLILFMCSVHGNNGTPVLSRIIGNTYVFHWYTSLVCPEPATTECLISNPETGEQYDFSGLAKADDNWVSYFTEDEKVERKLYINICRSLNPAPSCDRNAAACIVTINGEKEEKYLPNVGRATSSPQLLSSDHLQIHFKDGKSCTAHGENINYSTVVHFICSENDMARPKFIGKVGECQYSFLWTTKAACPLKMISVQNECVLTDPGSGFTFDLTSLKVENPYAVSAKNKTYMLNICEPVKAGCRSAGNPEGNITTACEIDEDGKITALSTITNFTVQYIERRHLIMTYFNKTKDTEIANSSEVIITMSCTDSTSAVQPVFIKEEDERYYFELKTPLVCVQEAGSCNFHDSKGNEYDITTLFRSSTNWEVVDGRRNVTYHINFCRPVVKVPSYKFPGGAPGAVMSDMNLPQNVSASLGVQLSEPTVSEDGAIIVHYTNGDLCKDGLRRSAHVTLICSHSQGELVFMGETPECEHFFTMKTPAACSAQTALGQNCIVTDPVYGYTFNLNYMKNIRVNFSVDDGEYRYYLGICDALTGFVGPCENSSVCQTKPDDPNFSKSLGLPNGNLVYSEGIISVTYNLGSLCHNKYNRSAMIKFTCEHPFGRINSKPYFISEAEDCTYLFEWPTTFACPPFHLSECVTVDDHGRSYDLSELSLFNDNYYIRNPMDLNQTFVINVCKSVVYSPGALCPYVSASCLLDPSNPDASQRSLNLGQVTEIPYFEDGKLLIKYTSGDPCGLEKDSSARFMETIIEFICDMEKIKSEPQFIGRDVCTYYFTWSTAYACSVNDTREEKTHDCVAIDPYTGFEFNLTTLKKEEPYIVKTLDHQYFVNVCGGVETSPCGGRSGVCQQELSGKNRRAWNAGSANSELLYQDGMLFLNYSNGAPCHNNAFKRSTIIHFHCNPGIGKPHFMYESSDCTYYFTWATEYACQPLVHCAVKNESQIFDLTPLTIYPYHSVKNHLDNDNGSYFISVCDTLTKSGVPVLCPVGSAVCRQSGDDTVSLGRLEYPPFVDFEGHATILYTNGSKCSTNPSQQYKSRIIFMCDPDEIIGKPELVRVEDDVCVYIFEWRTNIICPVEPTITPQAHECIFDDRKNGVHFDLSPLKKIGSYYEVDIEDGGGKFLLNICGAVEEKGCSQSAVCLKENGTTRSFGAHSSERITYDGGRLRVAYKGGESCVFNVLTKKSTEIILACRDSAGLGRPKLLRRKFSCLATFLWETNVVCQGIKHPCSFTIGNKEIDIYQLSSLSHNWNTTDAENNMYFMNLCLGLNQDVETKGCPTNAAVCMKQNDTFKALGLLHSVTHNSTESGDLVLTYSSGSANACLPPLDPNVQQQSATTKITLKCGLTLGQPVFVSGPDHNCVFHFVWETNVVCEGENEDLVYEGNGTLVDKRLGYEMDLSTILDRTYKVSGISQEENYTYVINIGQGYEGTTNKDDSDCSPAAVCQTKPEKNFYRDIGSVSSRRFREKGSELYLSLISHTRGCGKNEYRNVTTLFLLRCTSYAGDGSPVFMYESGGCDYIFNWDTNAVCSVAHRRVSPTESPSAAQDNGAEEHVSHPSSSAPAVIIAVLTIIIILCPVVYIVSKKERRSAAAAKIRSAFHRVTLPHFRYRRADGEMLILINGTQVNQSDAFKDDDLLS